MNKKVFAIFAGLVATASLGSAAAVTCNATTTNNVTTLAPLACAGSGVSFSNFTVTGTGPAQQVGLSNVTYDSATGIVNLFFNIVIAPALPGDLILGYLVSGPSDGIDFNVAGSPTLGSITFTELACSTQLCNGASNVIYANLGNAGPPPVQQASAPYATQTSVWIKKDLNYNSTSSQLTDFQNSHHTPVPEPMTLSMMGIGLLSLGLVRRRQQGRK